MKTKAKQKTNYILHPANSFKGILLPYSVITGTKIIQVLLINLSEKFIHMKKHHLLGLGTEIDYVLEQSERVKPNSETECPSSPTSSVNATQDNNEKEGVSREVVKMGIRRVSQRTVCKVMRTITLTR